MTRTYFLRHYPYNHKLNSIPQRADTAPCGIQSHASKRTGKATFWWIVIVLWMLILDMQYTTKSFTNGKGYVHSKQDLMLQYISLMHQILVSILGM